ncbi:hypothetical protein E2C01_068829 [Portunus trituberculatus]|uniref:Uncharacterized protein n=1 Tax=Portunus trituberculatus TaxID=210409 RepID=A0A5B7HPV1_PORTR|nr:hypothetical protein [Portunus trituberculatus]
MVRRAEKHGEGRGLAGGGIRKEEVGRSKVRKRGEGKEEGRCRVREKTEGGRRKGKGKVTQLGTALLASLRYEGASSFCVVLAINCLRSDILLLAENLREEGFGRDCAVTRVN